MSYPYEYVGRLYALREKAKLRGQFTADKVESAKHDIDSFLEANTHIDLKKLELLTQARDQLYTLSGFLQETS